MTGVEFLRERAAYFRKRAEAESDPVERGALLDLARHCDRLVEIMEGRKPDPNTR